MLICVSGFAWNSTVYECRYFKTYVYIFFFHQCTVVLLLNLIYPVHVNSFVDFCARL